MSHVSTRRDLSDPAVIDKFIEVVGDADTLRMLYILTRCDTAMTSPTSLSSWKDQLLGELYRCALAALEGERATRTEAALHRRQSRRRCRGDYGLRGSGSRPRGPRREFD